MGGEFFCMHLNFYLSCVGSLGGGDCNAIILTNKKRNKKNDMKQVCMCGKYVVLPITFCYISMNIPVFITFFFPLQSKKLKKKEPPKLCNSQKRKLKKLEVYVCVCF